jgi:hypothetical protein
MALFIARSGQAVLFLPLDLPDNIWYFISVIFLKGFPQPQAFNQFLTISGHFCIIIMSLTFA